MSVCTVTNYNNVVEPGSDSDDEDKLHIVEEEGSLADGADCDSTLPEDEHPNVRSWDSGEPAGGVPVITHLLKRALNNKGLRCCPQVTDL